MNIPVRRVLLALAASAATAAVAGPVASAQAELLGGSGCSFGALSQPFAPWGDNASYELAPGGDFESAGWDLSGDAQIVSGSEPFAATGTLGSSSLQLPAGSSATSPPVCVDASTPTLRFFDTGSGVLLVQVVYDGIAVPIGADHASGDWAPSGIMHTNGMLMGLLGGGSAQVSLRITALTGDPQVDDVFIDPWNRT
jgi:hypothetical protein